MTINLVYARIQKTTERVDIMTTLELSVEQRKENYVSHNYGDVDDCIRCVDCEVGIWNGWRYACPARN